MKYKTHSPVTSDLDIALLNLREASRTVIQARDALSLASVIHAKNPKCSISAEKHRDTRVLLGIAEQAELQAEQEWETANNKAEY